MLTRTTEQLNEMIELRNDVLRRLGPMSDQERFARMFGLPVPGGIDNLYRDYVDGIHQYTDDSIHFARMVADDLCEYGKRVRKKYQDALPRRQRRDVMMVPVVYWTDGENAICCHRRRNTVPGIRGLCLAFRGPRGAGSPRRGCG